MKFLKNLFRVKTNLEKLKEQHKDLLSKAFIASKTNRSLSDTYTLKANQIEEPVVRQGVLLHHVQEQRKHLVFFSRQRDVRVVFHRHPSFPQQQNVLVVD